MKLITPFIVLFLFFTLIGCGGEDLDTYYSISGQIVDEMGIGVKGVLITFTPHHVAVRTHDDGYWFKEMLRGEILVKPNHDQYFFSPKSKRVTKANNQVNFTMVKGQLKELEILENKQVYYGTPLSEIGLPTKVHATLDMGETVQLQVLWDEATPSYQAMEMGQYLFTGELLLPSNISNPKGLEAQITVVVIPLYVWGVDSIENIAVPWNTPLEYLELPETLTVTLNNFQRKRIQLSWEEDTPPYDKGVMGIYNLKGNLILPDYIENPNGMMARVRVIVQKGIKDVEELPDLMVPYGTPLSDLGLPGEVQVTMEDDSITQLQVIWNNGDPSYGKIVGGVFLFSGQLVLPTYVLNPLHLKADLLVTLTSYEVSGQVKEEGVGLGGVTISFNGGYSPVETGEDGSWIKGGLEGPVAVSAHKENYLFEPEGREVDGPAQGVDFTALPMMATVSVKVVVFGPTKIYRVTVHHVDHVEGALGYTIGTERQDFTSFDDVIYRLTNEEAMPLFILDGTDVNQRNVLASATLGHEDLEESKIYLFSW